MPGCDLARKVVAFMGFSLVGLAIVPVRALRLPRADRHPGISTAVRWHPFPMGPCRYAGEGRFVAVEHRDGHRFSSRHGGHGVLVLAEANAWHRLAFPVSLW